MTVQLISSAVFPWTWVTARSSPGFSRNRSATKIVPPTTPIPTTTAIQKNGSVRCRIVRAYLPAGRSAFCLLFGPVLSPQLASVTAAIATAAAAPARRNRCVRSNISLSGDESQQEIGRTLQRSILRNSTLAHLPPPTRAPWGNAHDHKRE